MDWVIDTHGLSKVYKQVTALNSLDLRVARNSIFGFLGPNGAGKTTTIKLLLGLIHPSAGSATVFGLDMVRDSVAIRARVGYLPQDPRFYESMSARQILDFTAHFFFKGPQAEIDRRVEETLQLVSLEDKADRPVKGFSGGERQRLGIAQAQVNYPDLLILDEPAASLDPMGRRDVLDVMERLRKYTTIFYCTHILDDVQRVSDSVAILNHGVLAASGAISDLLAGGEGVVYELNLKCAAQADADQAYQRLSAQAWVSSIQVTPLNGGARWLVSVSDADAAEYQLMRLVLEDKRLAVSNFHRKEYELEDVFVSIVEGAGNDRK